MRLGKILGLLLLLALTATAGVNAGPGGCLHGDCNTDCGECGGRLYFCDSQGYPVCACYNC